MSVSWTDEQLKAMEPGDGSLLVSAAAGSGKTAVLIERVLRRITDEKDPRDLDEFLIVTYTNAAASEMRYKLAQAIEDRIRETGNDRRLIRQLRLLPGAQIMTVHSFCHYFLRENFQALGLSPDFKIADSSELALLKESAIKDVLERAYEESEQNPGFLRLADEFSGMRGDKPLEDVILSLFEKLQSHPFPKLWMEEHRLDFDGAASVGETEYGKYLMGRALKTVESAEKFISDALSKIYGYPALTEKYAPAFEDDLAQLRSLSDMLRKGKWDEAAEFSGGMGFMKLSAVRGFPDAELLESVKAARGMSKKLAAVVRDKFLLKKSSEAETEQRSVSCIANELFRLVNAFDEEFSKQKRQRNLVDFSDLEHFAVNILCESYDIKTKACVPSETALSEASQFAEIFIDEYQDTNEVQDLIFKLISKKENNLFMVGDVKQSIYRFRLADPTIFLQKFNTYKDAGEPGENGKRRVILSKNFRSGDSVLDAVNFVFSYLMTGTFGEIKYGEKEYLNKGASYVYEDGEPYKTELLLLSMKTPENMQDTEEEELSKAEAEASMTAERISRMLKGSFTITDADSGEKRAVRPSDIAILLRTVSGKAQIYKSALGARGVPASMGAESGFFDRTEILVMTALLETIDNPRKDIPLIAAMRSPLYGFLEDELADIRVNERDGDFYDAVLKSAEAGNGKCRAFLDDIEEFRSCAVTMSVSRLIFHVYNKTGALGILSALPPGREREKNLLTLYEYAENYEHLSFKGLYSFLQYLKKISESGEIRKAPENASDAVTIMSIHKSKGLEFPVVFLCDCAKQFNEDDLRGRVLMHPGLGIGLFRKDEGGVVEYPTLLRSAVEESLRQEMLSEELRILYVGMTRAKEKLIMTMALPDAAEALKKGSRMLIENVPDESFMMQQHSPAMWLLLPLLADNSQTAVKLSVINSSELKAPILFEEEAKREKEVFTISEEEIKLSMEYKYPFGRAAALPSKLTPSELSHGLFGPGGAGEAGLSAKKPDIFKKDRQLTFLERGIAHHMAMQFIDFQCCTGLSDIEKDLIRLESQGFLTKAQRMAVEPRKILAFFRSEIGGRLIASRSVSREFQFSVLTPPEDIFDIQRDEGDDSEILLQGVIDCLFLENDGLVIIDFKTDRLQNAEKQAENYKRQLSAYAYAMERVMRKKVKETVLWFFDKDIAVKIERNEKKIAF